MASIGDVDRNVTITFIGRDNASRAMGSIGNSATKTTSLVGKLTKALKYAALAATAALAAGAVLLAKGLWDATKAAYENRLADEKLVYTQMKAQDATKAQTKATLELIDKMELQSRFSDDELRPALTNLALTGMSVKKSQDLLAVAMDVSEASGKPLLAVSAALAKGYNGTTTSLGKLGIKTKDAAGDALSFAEILKTLKERTKGAAREAANDDPWTVLGHAFQQVKEKIGDELLPYVLKFSHWMIKVAVPWIKEELVPKIHTLATWLGENLPKAANKISQWWDKSGREAFTQLWDKIKGLWGSVVDLAAAFSGGEGANAKMKDGGKAATNMADSVGSLVDALKPVIDSLAWIETHGQWLSRLNEAARLLNPLQNLASTVDNLQDGTVTLPGWMGPLVGQAKGGWIKRAAGGPLGNMTLVGEHGPELISNRGYVKSHSQSMGMGGGGGVTVNIYGPIDAVTTGREVRKALLSVKRAEGGRALGLA